VNVETLSDYVEIGFRLFDKTPFFTRLQGNGRSLMKRCTYL